MAILTSTSTRLGPRGILFAMEECKNLCVTLYVSLFLTGRSYTPRTVDGVVSPVSTAHEEPNTDGTPRTKKRKQPPTPRSQLDEELPIAPLAAALDRV